MKIPYFHPGQSELPADRKPDLFGIPKNYRMLFEAFADAQATRSELKHACEMHERAIKAELFLRVLNATDKLTSKVDQSDDMVDFDAWRNVLADELGLKRDPQTGVWR